jgi:hypothetical protein
MSVTITLTNPLAEELQTRAAAQRLSVEEFATRLLGQAVQQLDDSERWQAQNARRLALLRKSKTAALGADEQAELQQLQAAADRQLEQVDQRLLEELNKMRQAANAPRERAAQS